MKINHQAKAQMHAARNSADTGLAFRHLIYKGFDESVILVFP